MPDKMNMKIHVGVEYSGLPSPNLILPYLLNAKDKQNTMDKKVKINTGAEKTDVTQNKAFSAMAMDSFEYIAKAATETNTTARLRIASGLST